MSFIELLRQSRSRPVATLHKFLTNYDPSSNRVYAFVEGEPDKVFYRVFLERFSRSSSDVFVYNCEGKQKVVDAYNEILKRYPNCRRVLFFLDKDVDELVGITWPADPRIFTTEFYSVENYVICDEACGRYFRDFVKIRRVEIDLSHFAGEFTRERKRFHCLLLPIMAWVIAFRRRGGKLAFSDVNLEDLFEMAGTTVRRKPGRDVDGYLSKFKKTPHASPGWKDLCALCRELRRLDSRYFVRGHFESWWFVQCIRRMSADLTNAVKEAGGSVSFFADLTESNFIQILTTGANPPPRLEAFLSFHLANVTVPPRMNNPSGAGGAILGWVRSKLSRR